MKDDMNKTLNMFGSWFEKAKGLYRYVISAGACYEILIKIHYEDTDILTARADLYFSGDFYSANDEFFKRELLLQDKPVSECVKFAVKDYIENIEVSPF